MGKIIISAQNGKVPAYAVNAKFNNPQGVRIFFINELRDIYWAEKELTKIIPKMIENATSEVLVQMLTGHLEDIKNHVSRLEQVFSRLGEKAEVSRCEAMAGLIKEGGEIIAPTK